MNAAVCQACGEALPTELGCTVTSIEIRGHAYPVLPHAGPERCGVCGTTPFGNHHGDCPNERCPRCGGLLAECGCIARMGEPQQPQTEKIAWTIDEEHVASLSDSEAASAMDQVVFGLEEKITAKMIEAGAPPPDVMGLRYTIARAMLVELVRKLATMGASLDPGPASSPPEE